MLRFVRFGIVLLPLLFALTIACGNQSPISPSPTPDPRSYLEKRAEDLGVEILPNGHLRVGKKYLVRFLRVLAYWNAEAFAKGNASFYPRKVSGAYEVVPLPHGTRVNYKIHFSDDDFGQSPDLAVFCKEGAVSSYEKLNSLLTCRNAEAAATGREYKLKAWYEREEKGDTLLSDRLYVMIQFSFDMPRDAITPESAISARTFFPVEEKQDAIIARTAVEFAQILEKGEELAIIALDFIGPAPDQPEWVYIFDGNAIKELQAVGARKEPYDREAILILAQIQDRHAKGEQPSRGMKRAKEPISDEEIEIVARIAVETAKTMVVTLGITITIYDFKGRAPKDLTTWVYIFDGSVIPTLRTEKLNPKEVLMQAQVVEQQGELLDGRSMPPIKPILRETGK